MDPKRKIYNRKNIIIPILILSITLLGIIAGNIALKSTLQTKSKAEGISPTPADCTIDPQREDYCGDSPPFRGCNSPPAEWFCQCRLPNRRWWSECSIMESTAEKQRYRDKCGGDEQKAFLQWKYEIALAETGGQCSCGGQNVCGSSPTVAPTSIPTSIPTQEPIEPTETPVLLATPTPYPSITPGGPTSIITPTISNITPTSIPVNPTITNPTNPKEPIIILNTPTPTLIPKQWKIIDFEAVNNFLTETKKSVIEFFSNVLP